MTTFVYGLGLISTTDNAGSSSYCLSDGLGSTTQLTNSAGAVTDGYSYDVFGAPKTVTGTTANDFRFTAQQDDGNANRGLYYLRARAYDPALGRFLQRDPVPFVQRYAYVGNNPANLADPSGMLATESAQPSQQLHGDCTGGSSLGKSSIPNLDWRQSGTRFLPVLNWGGWVACSLNNFPFPTFTGVTATLWRLEADQDGSLRWSFLDREEKNCGLTWICQHNTIRWQPERGVYLAVADIYCAGCEPPTLLTTSKPVFVP